jgi:uncharacterized protein (DUF927 family)
MVTSMMKLVMVPKPDDPEFEQLKRPKEPVVVLIKMPPNSDDKALAICNYTSSNDFGVLNISHAGSKCKRKEVLHHLMKNYAEYFDQSDFAQIEQNCEKLALGIDTGAFKMFEAKFGVKTMEFETC